VRRIRFAVILLIAAAILIGTPPALVAQHQPTIAQYLKPGMPVELVSAAKVDRIAWIAYEEGKRNVFTAVGPTFRPVRVSAFTEDDGIDMTELRISDDGSTVVFVRGTGPNGDGWNANPSSNPDGPERAIWAARTATPGSAWRLAEGNAPDVSPDGRFVLYVKDGQIFRARVSRTPAATTPIDKGEKAFIEAWGRNSTPKWAPDGTKIAFSSNRNDHSFIGLYDVKTRAVSYLSPSVDRDTSPSWSPDSKHIAFLRRPGLPFGQQDTPGRMSGLPPATGRGGGRAAAAAPGGRGAAPGAAPGAAQPAAQPAAAQPAGQQAAQTPPGGRGRGGRGGRGDQPALPDAPLASEPGLYRAALPNGSTLTLMVADVATGEAKDAWHPPSEDRVFTNINAITWAGDSVVFSVPAQQNTDDESPRYYALKINGGAPVLLTSTDGIVEDQTAWTLSKDGSMFYYCTNTDDIDRRHIWGVPVSGGPPKQITTGDGIENVPVVLSSGKQIAVLSADAKRPMSVGIWSSQATPADVGQKAQKVIYPTLGPDFPINEEVVPTNVTLKAEDGVEFHNQLFLPKNMKPGEKHPAMIFVHGGAARQMLLGWHYLSFYHVFYGVNQWLASQGYIVLSVNYRLGVGYGRAFRQAGNEGGARGNAEYRDVLAAGKWLAAREDVDPNRVGIWGLSYGGLLTSEALARNSDIFKAGVDLAGVHLEGNTLNPAEVSYTSSAISEIDKWKSPVLLIQGDDDRNVNFSQMVGLVQLLRARNIYYELIVYPDDVHETLLHKRWLYSFSRMETFLNKFLGENASSKGGK
jgi:dipeptidyl aminopeptidase/acylaminoacyl peptidase